MSANGTASFKAAPSGLPQVYVPVVEAFPETFFGKPSATPQITSAEVSNEINFLFLAFYTTNSTDK